MNSRRRSLVASAVVAVFAALLPIAHTAAAVPAYLDPGFGSNGVAKVGALPVPSWASAVALQPDGKIVVGGVRKVFSNEDDAVVARLLPNGQLDTSFATNGIYSLETGPNLQTWAAEVAVQADGKIVILDAVHIMLPENIGTQLDLVRLDSTGHLDPTFGTGGLVHVTAPGLIVNTQRAGMTIEKGGKIIVASNNDQAEPGNHADMTLARFTTGGAPDTTFGTNGVARVDFGTEATPRDDFGQAVIVQADGKIVVGGQSMVNTEPYRSGFAIARFSSLGVLDPTFGDGGRVVTEFTADGEPRAFVNALALQADGRIVAAGTTLDGVYNNDPSHSVVARYTTAGALDTSFASVGYRINRFEVGGHDEAQAVALDTAGRIVIAGSRDRSVNGNPTSDAQVARFLPSGDLDPAFGGSGRIVTGLTPGFDGIMGLALQPDGRIVAAGYGGNEFSVLRYLPGTSVKAFGFNPLGGLGIGTTSDTPVPVVASGLAGAASVSSGVIHGLAVKGDGSLWSFGWNGVGQLGDGTTADSSSPVHVALSTPVATASAGWYHSLALDQDGLAWSWGWNAYGQLGDGTTVDRHLPLLVMWDVAGISAGPTHSLAVKRDGTVWAWGFNLFGQLGDGTTTDHLSPQPVPGLSGVVAVAAGAFHSLALKADGTVWAWGWNGVGQLGDGTATDRHAPVPVATLSGVTAIAAGAHHNFAVLADGTVRGWGWNALGQLGDGTTVDRNQPVPIAGLSAVVSIAAGPYHSIAAKADGTVRAWGWNGVGNLGTGTTAASAAPVVVPSLSGVTSVAAGFAQSFAVGT